MKALLKRILAGFGYSLKPRYKDYFWGNHKIVTKELYGRRMQMPASHSIEFNLAHFPYYNSNLQRIVKSYQQFRKEKFSIIDVGANIGDTLVMLRQVTELPIHCFEGDDYYFNLLERNSQQLQNVYIHRTLLAEQPGTQHVKGHSAFGTVEFQRDSSGGTQLNFDSIDHFLSNKFPDVTIGVLKTDTDGYDIRIIKGAAGTLKKNRPVIFMEYDRMLFEKNGDDGLQFLRFMKELDYNGILVYDNYGKLICTTDLQAQKTLEALHAYIKNNPAVPFYDLAFFASEDEVFFNAFSAEEISFFEQ